MKMTELIFDKNEDWEKRILCVDESCIGTIGQDGCCRECGKPYDGAINPAAAGTEIKEEPPKRLENLIKDDEGYGPDDDWENRVLCSDEACIGTIGPNGRCRECGKARN
jgi:hypothetical protein